jgi:hypothetical protein
MGNGFRLFPDGEIRLRHIKQGKLSVRFVDFLCFTAEQSVLKAFYLFIEDLDFRFVITLFLVEFSDQKNQAFL